MSVQNENAESARIRERIDPIADRFEAAWQAALRSEGVVPSIRDYVGMASGSDRSALVRELVELDVDYHARRGDRLEPGEYCSPFPELDRAWVERLVQQAQSQHLTQSSDQAGADRCPERQPAPDDAAATQRLRCPQCRNLISLARRSDDVVCASCGSSFRVQDTSQTSEPRTRTLGRFRLLECVGAGAFGSVWKARDGELHRVVALKIPHARLASSDVSLERFRREARAAAQLRHPGIVTVHEVAELDGLPTIVSDFIEGVTLQDLLKVRRLTFREAAELVAQVAEALDYAHSTGLVHRDLKPANMMIEFLPGTSFATSLDSRETRSQSSGSGRTSGAVAPRPLLMDFGLALRDEVEITLTSDGQIIGTPAYMSPEQAAGKGHTVDRRSDVYTLGVILYELLCGQLPFSGTKHALVIQILMDEPRVPRGINDTIPRDIETITLKCMAKEPGRRYETAAALAADLRRWLVGEPILARPVGPAERAWRWAKRNPRVAGLTAAVVLLVGAIIVSTTVGFMKVAAAQAETARKAAEADRNFADAQETMELVRSGAELLKHVPEAERLSRGLIERAIAKNEQWVRDFGDDWALRAQLGQTLLRLGELREMLGELAVAQTSYRRAGDLFRELTRTDATAPDHRFWLARTETYLGMLARRLGRNDEALQTYADAIASLDRLVAADPGNSEYRAALAIAQRNSGLALHDADRLVESQDRFRHAISEFHALIEKNPDDAPTRHGLSASRQSLGKLLSRLGHSDAAIVEYTSALDDFDRLVAAHSRHPDYLEGRAASRISLAHETRHLGRLRSAVDRANGAYDDYRDLTVLYEAPGFRNGLAQTVALLSDLYQELGGNAEAQSILQEIEPELRSLVRDHGDVPDYHRTLAVCRTLSAGVLVDLDRAADALPAAREAESIYDQLVKSHPHRPEYLEGRAIARDRLGQTFARLGDFAEATRSLDAARADFEQLVGKAPEVPEYRERLARNWERRAELLQLTGKSDEALVAYREALAVRRKIVDDLPGASRYLHNLAWFLSTCPEATLRDPARAVEAAEKAVSITPESSLFHLGLGVALYRAGELKKSLAALDQAEQLRRDEWQDSTVAQHETMSDCVVDGRTLFFQAIVREQLGDKPAAQKLLGEARAWTKDNAPGNAELARFQAEAEQIVGATP